MELIGTHTFTVQPFEVDFRGEITLALIISNLLNTAGHHANERGFGIKQLNQSGNTWVLSRLVIEMSRMPQEGETVKIETWIESVIRSFTQRNFCIKGEGEEILGYAKSFWAMINMESRRPASLAEQHLERFFCDKDCPIERAGKISVSTEGDKSYINIKYSDLDINKHLNSAKYVEHILNAFDMEELEGQTIKRLEMEYLEECRFGETIQITKTKVSGKEYLINMAKESGETACKSKIFLQ